MKTPIACALLLALSVPAAAQTPPPPAGPTLDLRLRYERVSDGAFDRDADASTLRARVGWRSETRSGWSFFGELEGTANFNDGSFNNTRNGNTAYPVVADPKNAEINQLYANYQPDDASRLTIGRQRIIYDNHRFFGTVGWRQNEQTFDAIDGSHSFGNGFGLRYSYLDRVQRIFGDDHPNRDLGRWNLSTHLISGTYTAGPGVLTGYAHFIDNQTLPLTSHRNLGLRYVAKGGPADGLGWLVTVEFANQDSYADGASIIDANYLLLEGGLTWNGNTYKLGFEQLGGDGRYGFQTPFATGHAFNGWDDKFLTTPVNGLNDLYLSAAGALGSDGWLANAKWLVAFHDFKADHGSADYGSEWDLQLSFPVAKNLSGIVKFADYNADQFARDTQKLWLELDWKI